MVRGADVQMDCDHDRVKCQLRQIEPPQACGLVRVLGILRADPRGALLYRLEHKIGTKPYEESRFLSPSSDDEIR